MALSRALLKLITSYQARLKGKRAKSSFRPPFRDLFRKGDDNRPPRNESKKEDASAYRLLVVSRR